MAGQVPAIGVLGGEGHCQRRKWSEEYGAQIRRYVETYEAQMSEIPALDWQLIVTPEG